jgi:hypothetical protein
VFSLAGVYLNSFCLLFYVTMCGLAIHISGSEAEEYQESLHGGKFQKKGGEEKMDIRN